MRRDLDLSQEELAERAQVDRSYLSKIENDRRPGFGSDMLGRIADALGTTSDYLLCLTDDSLPPPDMQPDELDPEVARLVRLIEGLPPQLQDRAIEYLEQQLETFERLFAGERQRSRESS